MNDKSKVGPGVGEMDVVLETALDSETTAKDAAGGIANEYSGESAGSKTVRKKASDDGLLLVDTDTVGDSVLDENASDIASEPLSIGDGNELSEADKDLLLELTKKTSSTERTAHAAKRESYLTMLGFDAKEVMPLYSRMCAMRIDPTFALLGDDPMSRVVRMDLWTEARRKVLPTPLTSAVRRAEDKRYFSIDTARAKAAFDDVEELNKMLIFSHLISGRLDGLLTEQRMFEREIEERIVLLNRREDMATDKVPSWAVLITRTIEAAGFGSVNHVAIRDNLVSNIAGAIEKSSSGLPAGGSRRRLIEDILGMIEETAASLPDGNDQTQKGDGAYDRMKTVIMDSLAIEESNMAGPFAAAGANDVPAVVIDGQPTPPALGSDDDDDGDIFGQQSGAPLTPAIDEKALGLFEINEPIQRSVGPGLIHSIENAEAAYAGFVSQYVGTMMMNVPGEPELGDVFIRLDERIAFPAEQFSFGYYRSISPMSWAKFEVPAGPYKLIQMKGQSSLLPRYTEHRMLPPVPWLSSALELLGATGKFDVQSSLKDWGPHGVGPAHMQSHVLDGPSGDPIEALELCRKMVAIQRDHWRYDGELSDLAIESVARWWLFLLAGRMRPGQIDLLWPDGFFHGVEGHDPIVRDKGHFRLVRCDGGHIGSALKAG